MDNIEINKPYDDMAAEYSAAANDNVIDIFKYKKIHFLAPYKSFYKIGDRQTCPNKINSYKQDK